MRNNEKAMKNIREAAELIASLTSAPHPTPDATDWKARCEAADAALQRIGMILGSSDEWTSQGNMIADVEDRLTAAQAENEKLRAAWSPEALHELAKQASLDAAKNANTVPQLLYAPILCALQAAARAALSPPPLSPEPAHD